MSGKDGYDLEAWVAFMALLCLGVLYLIVRTYL